MNLTDPIFTDPDKAREHLEATVWPQGAFCAHCGSFKVSPTKGGRTGLYQCNEKQCRKQFTATVGTVFERSKVPLHKWMLATYLMASSKKGFSAHQMHRTLGVTYKTAWFMAHRIREAMISPDKTLLGGPGQVVEVDETFIGRDPRRTIRQGVSHKYKVLSLVDRTTGRARSVVIDDIKVSTIGPIIKANVKPESRLMTDDANRYVTIGYHFKSHKVSKHALGWYVSKDDPTIHTNTIEGFFSIFKRGMKGVYQHCSAQHLQRYLVEFDFRYTNRIATGVNDTMRTDEALRGIVGKRLTYRRTGEAAYA